jgi:disease resistance protein RPM1
LPGINLVSKNDNELDKKLKVFSIVGFGGLGKTTMAMELCRQLAADIQLQAMVSASQAFDGGKDVKGLLVRVLGQILKVKEENQETTRERLTDEKIRKMDVEKLSSTLKELLDEKR